MTSTKKHFLLYLAWLNASFKNRTPGRLEMKVEERIIMWGCRDKNGGRVFALYAYPLTAHSFVWVGNYHMHGGTRVEYYG